MANMLKGNYKLKPKEIAAPAEAEKSKKPAASSSLQALFESSAMEKLGGSIAFVKKSAGFVWKGK